MTRQSAIQTNIFTAVVLGFLCWLGNTIFLLFDLSTLLPIGHIFVFLSAAALGPLCGLVSVAIGVVPASLFSAEYMVGLRLLIIALAIGYGARYRPSFPSYLLTLFLWGLVFAPALIWLNRVSALPTPMTPLDILTLGFAETALTVAASSLLLNSRIWIKITNSPRRLAFDSIVVHILAMCACGVFMFATLVNWDLLMIRVDPNHSFVWVVIGFSALMAAVALIGGILSSEVRKRIFTLFHTELSLAAPDTGFSGLSSEHWRRQSKLKSWNSGAIAKPEESQLDTVIEQYGQGICVAQRDGEIRFANRVFSKLLNLEDEKLTKKKLSELGLENANGDQLMRLIEQTQPDHPQRSELRLAVQPGQYRFLEISSQMSNVLEEDKSPETQNVLLSVKDITERRTIERHLLESQKLGSLGNLVSGIAHEFNNALTTINGHVSFAKQRAEGNPELTQTLDDILGTVSTSGDLCHQLLNYAEQGPTPMKSEELSALFIKQLDLLRKLVGEECEIEFSQPAEQLWVRCDSNLLMQALTNLMLKRSRCLRR